jgi:hypothetical protein|tara:strand:+ start:798 stop:989 length:192 start_codon:yes stop_codon:yes gene_type:complete
MAKTKEVKAVKEVKKPVKKVVKDTFVVERKHIDDIWDVVEELQENVNFINDKLNRIMIRMGLQ